MKAVGKWRHICVDAQRMFLEQTPWHVPWMKNVLPQLVEISERHASNTIFTRFMPPQNPRDAAGSWRVSKMVDDDRRAPA